MFYHLTLGKGKGKTVWSTKHFPHLIYTLHWRKSITSKTFSKRTIEEKEQNTAFENTVTLSLYHSWVWKLMLELNKYCTINASKQWKPVWRTARLIKYEGYELFFLRMLPFSKGVCLREGYWVGTEEHFIIKHLRVSKTQNRNKAWVLAVIRLKSCRSKIVHLLSEPTDWSKSVGADLSSQSYKLILYTLQWNTILFGIWVLHLPDTK